MSPQIKPWVLQFMLCCCFNIFQPWCWPQGPRTRHGVHHLRQFEGWWEERQSKRKRQRRWTKSWESWCLVWQWLTALEILEFEMNWCNCAHVSNHFQAIFFWVVLSWFLPLWPESHGLFRFVPCQLTMPERCTFPTFDARCPTRCGASSYRQWLVVETQTGNGWEWTGIYRYIWECLRIGVP